MPKQKERGEREREKPMASKRKREKSRGEEGAFCFESEWTVAVASASVKGALIQEKATRFQEASRGFWVRKLTKTKVWTRNLLSLRYCGVLMDFVWCVCRGKSRLPNSREGKDPSAMMVEGLVIKDLSRD